MAAMLSACATQSYTPRPLDAEAQVDAFARRAVSAADLKQYMLAHGHPAADWPVQHWGLTQLTLLAFFYNPDLQVARAKVQTARADVEVATQLPPLLITPRVEYHSREVEGDTSPWSIGFDVVIPLLSGSRRAAAADRARLLGEAAELDAGAATWQVRSRLRTSFVELYGARLDAASARAEVQARGNALALLERRLEAGYIGAQEVTDARLQMGETEARVGAARTASQRALGEIAVATGVPLEEIQPLLFGFEELGAAPGTLDARELRTAALKNRVDLRRRLLEFAAEDATVKLEIARQYPEVALKPGYLWDQGGNVWQLAVDLLVPSIVGNKPAIQRAEARREEAAQVFVQQQSAIIGQVAANVATYRDAAASARTAQQLSRLQFVRNEQVQKRFDAGDADRLDVALTQIESIAIARRADVARIEALRALGLVEDALQRPLTGGPLPALPAAQ